MHAMHANWSTNHLLYRNQAATLNCSDNPAVDLLFLMSVYPRMPDKGQHQLALLSAPKQGDVATQPTEQKP